MMFLFFVKRCSSRDVKQLAVSLTRDMVLSLKLTSDDSDVDGFIFGGRTKQDLHSVKRCAMNFIEEIIQEVGCRGDMEHTCPLMY